MLDPKNFKTIVENTPLVSIDLCIICDNEILLGKRNNEPLRGAWFTPGGRILKNETWQDCLRRIANSELLIEFKDINEFRLMGVWDHFYQNSAFDEEVSTHYVNLPHCIFMKTKPEFKIDDQHEDMSWFDLHEVATNSSFHKYLRIYALYLIEKGREND